MDGFVSSWWTWRWTANSQPPGRHAGCWQTPMQLGRRHVAARGSKRRKPGRRVAQTHRGKSCAIASMPFLEDGNVVLAKLSHGLPHVASLLLLNTRLSLGIGLTNLLPSILQRFTDLSAWLDRTVDSDASKPSNCRAASLARARSELLRLAAFRRSSAQ